MSYYPTSGMTSSGIVNQDGRRMTRDHDEADKANAEVQLGVLLAQTTEEIGISPAIFNDGTPQIALFALLGAVMRLQKMIEAEDHTNCITARAEFIEEITNHVTK